jgi:hypothetical protein
VRIKMSKDEGLISDECIYHEVKSGDGGKHMDPVWWLSPDITGQPPLDLGSPIITGTHMIEVKTHRGNGECNSPIEADGVIVDLYLCVPGPRMSTLDSQTVRKLGERYISYNTLQKGGSSTSTFPLTITANHPNKVDQPGHKCLVARSYPNLGTYPSPDLAYLPDDQHYAQRNLCIITCNSPCGIELQTANLNPEKTEVVTLRLVADLKPSRHVRNEVLKGLKSIEGFKSLTSTPPPPFKLTLPDFPKAIIKERFEPSMKGFFGLYKAPNIEAKFEMKPNQTTLFRFDTDLSKTDFGLAHIYHLVHLDEKRIVRGGVTLVTLRLRKRP